VIQPCTILHFTRRERQGFSKRDREEQQGRLMDLDKIRLGARIQARSQIHVHGLPDKDKPTHPAMAKNPPEEPSYDGKHQLRLPGV
jgi:hypothetical protein